MRALLVLLVLAGCGAPDAPIRRCALDRDGVYVPRCRDDYDCESLGPCEAPPTVTR